MTENIWYLLLGISSSLVGVFSLIRALKDALVSSSSKDTESTAPIRIAKANRVNWIVSSFLLLIVGIYLVIKFLAK